MARLATRKSFRNIVIFVVSLLAVYHFLLIPLVTTNTSEKAPTAVLFSQQNLSTSTSGFAKKVTTPPRKDVFLEGTNHSQQNRSDAVGSKWSLNTSEPSGPTLVHQWQNVMEDFCARHPSLKEDFPIRYRHLYYSDKYKIIYCSIPKVGCTKSKQLILTMNKVIPANTTGNRTAIHSWDQHPNNTLFGLSSAERDWRLKTYYKFVVYRDPLVRLLSAYIDKLTVPLVPTRTPDNGVKVEVMRDVAAELGILPRRPLPTSKPTPTPARKLGNIVRNLHSMRRLLSSNNVPQEGANGTVEKEEEVIRNNKKWIMKGPFGPVLRNNARIYYVLFKHYLEYYLKRIHLSMLNEHFAPSYALCNPCAVQFNKTVHFESLSEGMADILRDVGAPQWYYGNGQEHSKYHTDQLMDLFYSDRTPEELGEIRRTLEEATGFNFEGAPQTSVNRSLLQAVVERFSVDLDMYHSLYPSARRWDQTLSMHPPLPLP